MDRRIAKTKAAIIRAYLELTSTKDNHRITVTEIARIADIDRKTFYLHYSQVEDILEEMIHEKISALDALLRNNGYYEEPSNYFLVVKSLNELILSDVALFTRMAKDPIFNGFWWRVESLLYEAILNNMRTDKEGENYKWIYARFTASGNIAVYKAWLLDHHGIDMNAMNDEESIKNYLRVSRLFSHTADYEDKVTSSL